MYNIIVALKVWCKQWNHRVIHFYCDNFAVVHVVHSGSTQDSFLALCLRNIWLICAQYDIKVVIRHVRGKQNMTADLLSRMYSDSNIDEVLLQKLKEECVWHRIPYHYFVLGMSL